MIRVNFGVQHNIEDVYRQEQYFETESDTFTQDFSSFCKETGRAAKDILTFKIAQKVKQTGKDFNEICVSIQINLCIYWGDVNDVENFSGTCTAKIVYHLEPADPCPYMVNFSVLNRTIANLIIKKYQNFGLFEI